MNKKTPLGEKMSISEKLSLIKSITKLKAEIKELEAEKGQKINELSLEDKRLLEEVKNAKSQLPALQNQCKTIQTEIKELLAKKEELNNDYIELNEEVLYQSYGIFIPEYRYELSEEYKNKLDQITNSEKELVKDDKGYKVTQRMQLNNSQAKGDAMQKKNGKLAVRAFKSETDDTIKTISPINFQSKQKKIDQVFKQINSLNVPNGVQLTEDLKKLTHKKLELMFEYKLKIAYEKEQVKAQKEQLREEAKAKKELEVAYAKLENEKQKFIKEQFQLSEKLLAVEDEVEKKKIQTELANIENYLHTIKNEEVEVSERLSNTRAGHVYIISNIGSFGEQVFKIGMTRRMEPLDRVKELGDASVPFTFDVHALIFTEDAYELESHLHNHFSDKRVNKVNPRKEFFNVALKEIKDVVQNVYNKPVEFIDTPEAIEYQETLVLERQ